MSSPFEGGVARFLYNRWQNEGRMDTLVHREWPPQSGVRPIRQENKLLIATAFSPVR